VTQRIRVDAQDFLSLARTKLKTGSRQLHDHENNQSEAIPQRLERRRLGRRDFIKCVATASIGVAAGSLLSRFEQPGIVPAYASSYPSALELKRRLNPLHVDQNRIVDDTGREIYLRGINRSGLEYPVGSCGMSESDVSAGNYGSLITEDDFVTMRSWGVNVVRLPFGWGWLEPTRGAYDLSYVQRLEQVISWANDHGMYVIVNNHLNSFLVEGSGGWSPAWVTDPEFWETTDLQQAFIDSWVWLAERWRKQTGIAAYDLFNEPNSPAWVAQYGYDTAKSKVLEVLFSDGGLYSRAINAIRNVADKHICVLQPYGGDQPDVPNDAKPPIDDQNIVYTMHMYPLEEPNFAYAPWYATLLSTWYQRERNWNVPIFVGEWGVPWRLTTYTEDDCVTWATKLCEDFGSSGFHWTYWSFKRDKNASYYVDEGSAIYSPGGERPILPVLKSYFGQ
jgi:aryl-phospho-beta-D-glucosidase BglC (GH1 family)